MHRNRLALLVPGVAALLAIAVPVVWSQPPAPPAAPAAPATETKVDVPPPANPEEAAARAIDQKFIELGSPGKDGSEVMRNLTHLSDVIGPRLTGSDNLKRANEWAAEKMKQYGLSNVHLEPWPIPVGWERGTATARLIEPDNGRTITLAAAGWSPGTKGKVEGDVVIVRAQNKDDLAKYKGKLKNAIVMRSPPANVRPISDSTFNPPGMGGPGGARGRQGQAGVRPEGANPNPPAANPQSADRGNAQPPGGAPPAGGAQPPAGGGQGGNDQFFRGPNRAFANELSDFLRAEGAVAVLNDSGKPHGLLTMSGAWRSAERASAAEPLPSLYVTHDHYAMLWRLASRPDAKTRMELEVNNKFIPGPVTVYNTVGEIRGSEKPDEFVVVGAHLDSWDLGQGTTDNGTGSCVVLEAARILAKSGVQPKRTIRFVLFTGEEEGLHGSREYVKAHEDEMPKTSIAIVHDTGTGRVVGIGTQRRDVLKPIFERELTSVKALGVKEINTRGMGGSDHQSFDGKGVPGIMFQQDPAEYRFTHHSQSDTLDKAREPDLVQGAQVMAIFAMRMANLDSLLPRDKATTAAPTTPGTPAATPARRDGGQ